MCTDNAAMIAAAAHFNLAAYGPTSLGAGADPGLGFPGATPRASGPRGRPGEALWPACCRKARIPTGHRRVSRSIRIQGGRLVTAARLAPTAAGPELPRLGHGQLLAHVEAVHCWVAEILATKATARPALGRTGSGTGFAELADAYDAGLAELVGLFEVTDPPSPSGTGRPTRPPRHSRFRRMARRRRCTAGTPRRPPAPPRRSSGSSPSTGSTSSWVRRPLRCRPPDRGTRQPLALVAAKGRSWRLALAPDRLTAATAGGAGDGHGRGLGPVPLAPPPDPREPARWRPSGEAASSPPGGT